MLDIASNVTKESNMIKSLVVAGLLSLSFVAPAIADTTTPAKPASVAKTEKPAKHKKAKPVAKETTKSAKPVKAGTEKPLKK